MKDQIEFRDIDYPINGFRLGKFDQGNFKSSEN